MIIPVFWRWAARILATLPPVLIYFLPFLQCINIQWCISQTQHNFIMIIIVLGQHVSSLIESSSGPSKKQILRSFLEGPEDDSMRSETCYPSTIINIKKFWYFADRASQYIYLNINQLDALNFIMSLFHAYTCFEHMCSSSGGQNCTKQSLVSSHL